MCLNELFVLQLQVCPGVMNKRIWIELNVFNIPTQDIRKLPGHHLYLYFVGPSEEPSW